MSNTTTATLTPAQIGGIKRSKKYASLLDLGFTEAEALSSLAPTQPVVSDRDAKIAGLVAAGFSQAEATAHYDAKFGGAQHFTPAPVAVAVPTQAAPVQAPKDLADALVAQNGLAFGKGRVYATGSILEAAARVLKGGKPEVVQTSGKGRVSHVVIFREESGDVAIQNCYKPV